MALSDEEKLRLFVRAINKYLEELTDWNAVLTLLGGLTKEKFINFVKAKMQELQAESLSESALHTGIATEQSEKAEGIDACISEIDVA